MPKKQKTVAETPEKKIPGVVYLSVDPTTGIFCIEDPKEQNSEYKWLDQFKFDNFIENEATTQGVSSSELIESIDGYELENNKFRHLSQNHLKIIQEKDLITAYFVWLKPRFNVGSPRILSNAVYLLDYKLIPFTDKEGNRIKIKNFDRANHIEIIDKIRSIENLSVEIKEGLVLLYLNFAAWLWNEANRPCPVIDPDRERSKGRALSYDSFAKLLSKLDSKMRIIAKLLYFGGKRTLDDVLKVDFEDINFKQNKIIYTEAIISYPGHLFEDIKHLTHGEIKKKGHVITGRGNAPLNPSTIFRNFKEAGLDAGLGTNFTHKDLTTDK